MRGHLAYEFLPQDGGTKLVQRQTLSPSGFLRIFGPIIKIAFGRRVRERSDTIKIVLESGWRVE